ncbi:hypothetical protein GN958_ATG10391 [Phytophthora infestans]|uniref:Uncharacterized protein n=1 Tax=Phytophthora infestans TaxID=4787 RepID=A0A8S9UMW4_PHYIN|nr:hypothetical protein GN958_ATG10391 [Phytophthora infestans]
MNVVGTELNEIYLGAPRAQVNATEQDDAVNIGHHAIDLTSAVREGLVLALVHERLTCAVPAVFAARVYLRLKSREILDQSF